MLHFPVLTLEQFHVGLEVLLSIVIPGAVWTLHSARAGVERIADKRAAIIKSSLDAHEVKDEERFEQHAAETQLLLDKIDRLGEEREKQHTENQVKLGQLTTQMQAWQSWYEKWQSSQFGR